MRELIELIATACTDDVSANSVADLAAILLLHVRSLERKCQAVGTTARNLAGFVACARVVLSTDSQDWSKGNHFPERDPRTAQRLCEMGGLNSSTKPTMEGFIRSQRFIENANFKQSLIEMFSDVRGSEAAAGQPASPRRSRMTEEY